MAFNTIKYEKDGAILTITLNRPERMNAFTVEMAQELVEAIDMADADNDIRVIILTGEGKAFCAGADLGKGGDTFSAPESESGEPDWKAIRDTGGVVTLRFFNCTKPMIGVINGPAVGIGATMVLPLDIRLAADDAKMGYVFCSRGIVPDGASSWFLPQIVGLPQTLEWVLTGRVFPIQDALKAGLVKSIHPKDQLMAEARKIADEIVNNVSAVSAAIARQMIWRMASKDHPMEAHEHETRGLYWT
ncbi:MAG TPA: enoyl-CoA hydratase-related protein, partial [Pseudomonadales bacterium]|nr:enoyl-CoA hydratase-related protein [Pseudomonadales bacterium]